MLFHIATAKTPDQPLQILQLTDSHLLEDPEKKFAGASPFKSLQAVLAHVSKHQDINNLDVILSTGDIAQESSLKTYQQYRDAIAVLDKPHYLIRGNHDESIEFPDLEDKDDPTVILVGTWCIILLNSQRDHCVYGEISDAQLKKLSVLLNEYQNYHVLIGLHHHTFAMGSEWLDQHILKNADAFTACLAPYQNIKLVICGHVHQTSEYSHNGVMFLSTPSTFIQFKPHSSNFCLDDRPPGYRMLNLYTDGRFSSEVYYLPESVGNIDQNLSEY